MDEKTAYADKIRKKYKQATTKDKETATKYLKDTTSRQQQQRI